MILQYNPAAKKIKILLKHLPELLSRLFPPPWREPDMSRGLFMCYILELSVKNSLYAERQSGRIDWIK